MNITGRNRDTLNQEELWHHLQDAWRNLLAKLPEKLCGSVPRTNAVSNAKCHTKYWFDL